MVNSDRDEIGSKIDIISQINLLNPCIIPSALLLAVGISALRYKRELTKPFFGTDIVTHPSVPQPTVCYTAIIWYAFSKENSNK
jgi:hypothetical protein